MTTMPRTLHPRNRRLILALICLPVFIGALDLTIISAVLPAVVIDLEIPLETSLDDAAWAVSGYLIAYAVTMSFMGRVSDLVGRRRVFLICLVIFIAGSWLVATCDQGFTDLLVAIARQAGDRPDRSNVALMALIIGRVVQALGAGAMVPVSMALVGDLFPPEQRAQPLGVIAAADTIGWVLGSVYGGVMVKWLSDLRTAGALQSPFFDWQILFFINIPIGIVVLAVTWWVLRGTATPTEKGRFDYLGAVFITLAHVALNLGLGASTEATSGVTSFDELSQPPEYAAPMLVGGLAALGLFIWWELRHHDPLHNLRLFARRVYGTAAVTNFFVGFALMIGLVSVPILINVRQTDTTQLDKAALESGLLLFWLMIPMALAALPGGWLTSRYGYRAPVALGLAIALVGFALMGLSWTGNDSYVMMALQLTIAGAGLGLTFSPISAAAVNSAAEHERGSVSALVIMIRLTGMTISMSSLTTFALRRVTVLTAAVTGSATFDMNAATHTVFEVTVQVIRELMLLGAGVCLIALIPALLMGAAKAREQLGGEPQPASSD
ncbi:MAG: MFS transporter [Anaerolineae bacterium]|nr:MFS transporter [Anaerolineae bacterium]